MAAVRFLRFPVHASNLTPKASCVLLNAGAYDGAMMANGPSCRRQALVFLCWIGSVGAFISSGLSKGQVCSASATAGRCRSRGLPVANTAAASAVPDDLPRLSELLEEIKSLEDDHARRVYLVGLGDRFAARPEYNETLAISSWPRVPGCVSVVHVNAMLSPDRSKVQVSGTADSRVARGLVALVADGFSGASPDQILGLDPMDIAKGSGIRSTLTPGRQNGLVNIIKTVQDSVRDSAAQQQGSSTGSLPRPEPVVPLITSYDEDVAVLLSGGVDSSVALNLLLKQGLKPRAFYLKIWLEDEVAYLGECPWEEDWAFAEAVCKQAGVPLEAVPLQKEYWDKVVSHTIAEARAGRTPNPDIMCNSMVKFGVFYDHVGKHFDRVVTGHYARAQREEGRPVRLFRSPDRVKDQTYFLSRLRQDQLARADFPIGLYTKPQIRELAASMDLPTKARKDSQGICFLGKLKFDDFLRHYLGENPGDVVWDDTGLVIGTHRGLWFHTIGQRKGIVPVLGNAYRPLGPWYVTGKDIANNVLHISNRILAEGEEEQGKCNFIVEDFSWISGSVPDRLRATGSEDSYEVQIRHGPISIPCTVKSIDADCKTLAVSVDKQQKLAAGQYAALYEGDECLGAGVISERTWSQAEPLTE